MFSPWARRNNRRPGPLAAWRLGRPGGWPAARSLNPVQSYAILCILYILCILMFSPGTSFV